jgi:rare lipoprotein A
VSAARSLGRGLSAALMALALAACGTTVTKPYAGGSQYRAGHPSYRVEPYQVNGVWYHPTVDYDYDQTGTASWYGEQFDQRYTSNGEIFDMNRVSAAHKTLPLPSVVQVTNLENGRALELRVNDRGPFVGERLIDVSRRAAQLLGFETKGTAQVRVQVLKEESIQVAAAAQRGEFGPVELAAAPVAAVAPRPAAPTRPAPPAQLAAAPPAASPPIEAPSMPAAAPPPPAPPAPVEPPPAQVAAAEPAAVAPPPRPTVASRIGAALFPPAAAAPLEKSSLLAVKPSGRIFVQAGAFAMRDNAARVQSRIAGLGAVQVVPASVNGTEVFRVRLGPLSSVEEADHLLARVVGSGYSGARIVGD